MHKSSLNLKKQYGEMDRMYVAKYIPDMNLIIIDCLTNEISFKNVFDIFATARTWMVCCRLLINKIFL